jgi:spore germination protein GerM
MTGVQIVLSPSQIARVVRDGTAGGALIGLLEMERHDGHLREHLQSLLEAPEFSQSTLRALLTLLSLPADADGVAVTVLSSELQMSSATAHRYLKTWRAVGLVSQNPKTQHYRRVHISGKRRQPRGGP